jgi:histidine triad (HIT) family protein
MEESSQNCIFCRIVAGEIPGNMVHSDDDAIVIKDVNPKAPTHLLVIPRRHVKGVADLDDQSLMGKLFMVAAGQGHRLLEKGFRLVVNSGDEGGQTVDHLHVHVLGGRQMTWPPG